MTREDDRRDRSGRRPGGAVRRALGAVPPVVLAVLLGLGLVAVAWVVGQARVPGPVTPVQRALELRRARSRDASAYAEVFVDVSVARTLASDGTSSTTPPVPEWERPYVSEQGTSSADVVVVWRRDRGYREWPPANVFTVQRAKGAWRIVDASALPSGAPLPKPAR